MKLRSNQESSQENQESGSKVPILRGVSSASGVSVGTILAFLGLLKKHKLILMLLQCSRLVQKVDPEMQVRCSFWHEQKTAGPSCFIAQSKPFEAAIAGFSTDSSIAQGVVQSCTS